MIRNETRGRAHVYSEVCVGADKLLNASIVYRSMDHS